MSDLTVTEIDVDLLKGFEENPRIISEESIERLKKSIRKFGLFKPLMAWKDSSGRLTVIGGNQRLRVLKEMRDQGEVIPKKIPVIEFVGSEKAAKIIAIRDNKSDGDWDWSKLPTFVSELTDIAKEQELDPELMGFASEDLNDLIELAGAADADIDRYSYSEEPEESEEALVAPQEGNAKDKVRKRFARFVIGNVRGRITVDQYGEWLEIFEKYSDKEGSTDIPVILSSMLDDLEKYGQVGILNAD